LFDGVDFAAAVFAAGFGGLLRVVGERVAVFDVVVLGGEFLVGPPAVVAVVFLVVAVGVGARFAVAEVADVAVVGARATTFFVAVGVAGRLTAEEEEVVVVVGALRTVVVEETPGLVALLAAVADVEEEYVLGGITFFSFRFMYFFSN